jgi:hypothetical protein
MADAKCIYLFLFLWAKLRKLQLVTHGNENHLNFFDFVNFNSCSIYLWNPDPKLPGEL